MIYSGDMRTIPIVMSAFALIATPSALSAQRRPSETGFWWSVGVAPGWTRVTCDICAGRRSTGMSAFVGLGSKTSRAIRIGGELGAWRQSDPGLTQTLMAIGAAAYWYPSARRRMYLRGGAALVMHRASDGTDVVTSSGIGPQLGIGYEHAASPRWLVGPF